MDEKLSFIKHYQNSIEKSQNNPERVLHCLKKLQNLRINVQDLQETGIGKTVNSLRKHDGEAGELATKLVTKWKDQISKMDDHIEPSPPPPQIPTPSEKSQNDSPSKKHSSSTANIKSSSSSENIDTKKSKSSHSSSSSSHHHHHHHHSSSNNSSGHKHSSDAKKSADSKSSDSKHHSKSQSSHKSSSSSSSKRHRDESNAESKENEAKKLKSDKSNNNSSGNGSKSDTKESKSSKTESSSISSSKKKDHKSSSSTKRKLSSESNEFDSAQGMGFAECLMAFDMPSSSSSSKHKKQDQLADKIVSIKNSSGGGTSSKSRTSHHVSSSSSSSSHKKDKEKSSSSRPSTWSEQKMSTEVLTQPPKLLTQKPKLELPDIVSELPNDVSIPEYRPIPMNSAMKDYILGSNSQSRHAKMLTEGDLLAQSFSSKANRTRVFSGNSKTRSDVPKLFDMCIRILQENIDYIESTGGVPFDILKPVLERAKPDQLSVIEYYNPYLLDDSDVLWKPHCQRKWKNKQPVEAEMETWREMYERCTREDEEKLSRLAQNIKQQQAISSNGIQKTKMAYVDSMVKPPRGVVRKQEQFGTNRKLVVSPAARVEALKNLQPNLAAAGDVRLRVSASLRDDAQQVLGRGGLQRANLTKKAPMMAKILSKFKR